MVKLLYLPFIFSFLFFLAKGNSPRSSAFELTERTFTLCQHPSVSTTQPHSVYLLLLPRHTSTPPPLFSLCFPNSSSPLLFSSPHSASSSPSFVFSPSVSPPSLLFHRTPIPCSPPLVAFLPLLTCSPAPSLPLSLHCSICVSHRQNRLSGVYACVCADTRILACMCVRYCSPS